MTGGLAHLLLSPVSALYKREITRRNAKYDRGEGVVTLDRPVISIGNLSVGGTGKSPTVAMVVRTLREAGFWPAVAMRGYGSGKTEHGSSDEADEYRALFPDLPIVAQPNRTLGLIELFGTEEGERVDTIVLDDGFQHRRLARQVDVVLIDCTRSPIEDALLPAGRLRETMDSLARAHAVILTHAESVSDAEIEQILRAVLDVKRDLVIAVSEHAWGGLDVTGEEGPMPVGWLSGKRVVGVCAIGNPGPFFEALKANAGEVVGEIRLRDHDPYRGATVQRIVSAAQNADAIVCTAKDWSKLRHVEPKRWPVPVVRPGLTLRMRTGERELSDLILRAARTGVE